MDSNNIKEYLSTVKDLETQLYEQEQLIDALNYEKARLGRPANIPHPSRQAQPRIPQLIRRQYKRKKFGCGFGLALLAGFILACIILTGIPGDISDGYEDEMWISFISIIAGMGICGYCYYRFVIHSGRGEFEAQCKQDQEIFRLEQEKYQQALIEIEEQYERDLENFNRAVGEDNQRVKAEELQKVELEKAIKECEERKKETEMLLQKFYNKNIIYPKYRNFIAIVTIYEYFDSGRCTELVGASGAYNLFEDEIRKDMIIVSLEQIIQDLEQIRRNQYLLYHIMNDISSNVRKIAVDTREILDNTYEMYHTMKNMDANISRTMEFSMINAYNTRIISRNTTLQLILD